MTAPSSTAPVLPLTPSSASYTTKQANEIVATDLPGGPPATRRDFIGATHAITVQWACDPLKYSVLEAFFRTTTAMGSLPFQCELIIDDAPTALYECKFVPGSYGLQSQSGHNYVVGANLYASQIIVDDAYDVGLITAYSAFGDQLFASMDQLSIDVNIKFAAL